MSKRHLKTSGLSKAARLKKRRGSSVVPHPLASSVFYRGAVEIATLAGELGESTTRVAVICSVLILHRRGCGTRVPARKREQAARERPVAQEPGAIARFGMLLRPLPVAAMVRGVGLAALRVCLCASFAGSTLGSHI